jgi:AcrR family transcriptional regulator
VRRLFYHKGYGATSYADIAEVTGYGKGNIHCYFKTKEDILHAVTVARLQDFRSTLAGWEKGCATLFACLMGPRRSSTRQCFAVVNSSQGRLLWVEMAKYTGDSRQDGDKAMDRIDGMRAFVAVVETGSFSAAGRRSRSRCAGPIYGQQLARLSCANPYRQGDIQLP